MSNRKKNPKDNFNDDENASLEVEDDENSNVQLVKEGGKGSPSESKVQKTRRARSSADDVFGDGGGAGPDGGDEWGDMWSKQPDTVGKRILSADGVKRIISAAETLRPAGEDFDDPEEVFSLPANLIAHKGTSITLSVKGYSSGDLKVQVLVSLAVAGSNEWASRMRQVGLPDRWEYYYRGFVLDQKKELLMGNDGKYSVNVLKRMM
jgi:hypothetical protein